ncbi:type VII secretion target [Lentzea sp.]|uniref:type VII secretion target n=1 Tax=Lentzea sp. TaxID=56099 RepID=UPI002C7EB164|nr:type VII secretion target [Lentzea sp.]HUQ55838.1 type VII secretion target [Lentzea sp.]
MTGFHVEAEQLRSHAGNIDKIKQRLAKVKAASSHITADDQAYGLLCGWISGVLEGRHTDIDAVIATVEGNLELVAKELRASADAYETTDQDTVDRVRAAGGER